MNFFNFFKIKLTLYTKLILTVNYVFKIIIKLKLFNYKPYLNWNKLILVIE